MLLADGKTALVAGASRRLGVAQMRSRDVASPEGVLA
jgi:hypothetical protein